MHPFQYHRATSEQDAITVAATDPAAAFIAGGSDLLQLWKADIQRPSVVIDITGLPLCAIETHGNDLAMGALVRMSEAADHPLLLERCPAIVAALRESASPQVRNQATLGGNLLQRTRCGYFRSRDLPCNKRAPGSGCGALQGENRLHALFGTSDQCVATHASDLAVALLAADARLCLRSKDGERWLALDEFFLAPQQQPQFDHALARGELLTQIVVPDSACTRRSHYLKVRDRAAFEFALVAVAVGLRIEAGQICEARIVAGGVGTKPWRLQSCEALLIGQAPVASSFSAAARSAVCDAVPLRHNGFKIELLQRTLQRALQTVADAGWPRK